MLFAQSIEEEQRTMMFLQPFDIVRIAFSLWALYRGIRNPFSVRVVHHVYRYKTIIMQGCSNSSTSKSHEVTLAGVRKNKRKHRRKASGGQERKDKDDKILEHEEKDLKSLPHSAPLSVSKKVKSKAIQEFEKCTNTQQKPLTPKDPSSSPVTTKDEAARKSVILDFKSATKPCTFTVTTQGGVVKTPYCAVFFPPTCVLSPLSITLTPKYPNENLDKESGKIFMTPELVFDSKDAMKFDPPVELEINTPFSASSNSRPINVEIQRTEHSNAPNWQKIGEMEFKNGVIRALCHQFCRIRTVCNACEREFMSTRISYSYSFDDSKISCDFKREFMLRVFTDSPELSESIRTEMAHDNHRRIHPTQSLTLKHGNHLLTYLSCPGMHCDPPLKMIEIERVDEIISKAIRFTLSFKNNTAFQSSDQLDIECGITGVSKIDKTDIRFSCAPVSNPRTNYNVTVNGGVGLQFNNYQNACAAFVPDRGASSHSYQAPPSISTVGTMEPFVQGTETNPKRVTSPVPVTSAAPTSVAHLRVPTVSPSQLSMGAGMAIYPVPENSPHLSHNLSLPHPSPGPSAFTPLRKIHSTPSLTNLYRPTPEWRTSSLNQAIQSPRVTASDDKPFDDGPRPDRPESFNSIDEDAGLHISRIRKNEASEQEFTAGLQDGHCKTSSPRANTTGSLGSVSAASKPQRNSAERNSKLSELESGFVTRNASGLSEPDFNPLDSGMVTEKLLCKDEGTQTSMPSEGKEMSYSDAVKTRYRLSQPFYPKPVMNRVPCQQTKGTCRNERKKSQSYRKPWKP